MGSKGMITLAGILRKGSNVGTTQHLKGAKKFQMDTKASQTQNSNRVHTHTHTVPYISTMDSTVNASTYTLFLLSGFV
jgi:hypothetical protein